MRMIEIVIGVALLGGSAWTAIKTYKSRGTSAWFILVLAMFLAALGLFFLFGAFTAVVREFRISGTWIK
ncbi:MAG TPA: hypothetical protein VFZ40_00595 [Pyrinomonadaceae bacterium]